MKLAPTESSSSASTSQTTKYRLLSDAKIVALIANCLSVNTRESVVKVVDDSDVSDIMHECGLVIDEFLAGALNDVDAVAGLVRVVELVSSKIRCVWMIFTSDGGYKAETASSFLFMLEQDRIRQDHDYNDALKRAKQLQSSKGPLPLCVQDDEFYKPVIVCAYNLSKDKESSLILKEDGSVEVRGQNEFCRKMESHFCGIDDDNKRDSFHSLSSLLEKPAGYHNPKHLIVFVHGLLGSSFDFRTYRNQIISTLRCSSFEDTTDHEYLMSEVNEEQTLNDISVLADRLASEIVTYVRDKKMYIVSGSDKKKELSIYYIRKN
ncbi:hypothetical protein BDR26DRAFT_900185 [Obelidium mucronatum]|nr:hypothetical protein BDR26DRAFT_900185 [Obelidium mucronatum]